MGLIVELIPFSKIIRGVLFMNINEVFLLVVLVSVGIIIYQVVRAKSSSKNMSTLDGLDILSKFLNASESLHNFIDKDPKEDKMEVIIKACKEAVLCAEELEKSGVLTKEQKKEKVVEFLHVLLKTSGVNITPKVEKLVDLFIEGAVLLKNE